MVLKSDAYVLIYSRGFLAETGRAKTTALAAEGAETARMDCTASRQLAGACADARGLH